MATEKKRNLQKYEAKLRALYADLLRERESLESGGIHQEIGESSGDLARHEDHPADAGTDLYIRERDALMERNVDHILRQCERALEKIDEGTYGLSDESGTFIGEERLDAVPYATLTVSEQERADGP